MNDLFPTLTEEQQAALRPKLWALLARQVNRRTQGDSSSLRAEAAEELFASLCYTLQKAGLSSPFQDVEEAFSRGQTLLREEVEQTRLLYRAVRQTSPNLDCLSLRDTLDGLALFFRQYDVAFFAHQTPCEIDYQLALPVSEALQGVDYIRTYLQSLLIENELLSRFSVQLEQELLERYYGNFREALVNLYEPVASAVLGLTLLGESVASLELNGVRQERLTRFFGELTAQQIDDALARAAEQAADTLRLRVDGARPYLRQTARQLAPRIVACRASGDLSGIFPA